MQLEMILDRFTEGLVAVDRESNIKNSSLLGGMQMLEIHFNGLI